MFFRLFTLYYALYFEVISGALRDMRVSTSKGKTKFSPITPVIQYYSSTICAIPHQFLPSKGLWGLRRKYESNDRSCIIQYIHSDMINRSNSEVAGHCDTLTDEDVVLKQYSLLPYPIVTGEDLEREKTHYNGIK